MTLGIYGHNHAVQRLSAAYRNRTVLASVPALLPDGNTTNEFRRPRATVHAVIGTGGAGFTVNAHDAASRPSWSERVFYSWGYARLTAVSPTVLDWEFLDSTSRAVTDRMRIIQDLAQPWADAPEPKPAAVLSGAWVAFGAVAAVLLTVAAAAFSVRAYRRRRAARSQAPAAVDYSASVPYQGIGA